MRVVKGLQLVRRVLKTLYLLRRVTSEDTYGT